MYIEAEYQSEIEPAQLHGIADAADAFLAISREKPKLSHVEVEVKSCFCLAVARSGDPIEEDLRYSFDYLDYTTQLSRIPGA
jgi:hypothetical protein